MQEIFSGFGVLIFKSDNRFYIECDSGEIVVQILRVEITEAEAQKAQRSEQDAYEVLMSL